MGRGLGAGVRVGTERRGGPSSVPSQPCGLRADTSPSLFTYQEVITVTAANTTPRPGRNHLSFARVLHLGQGDLKPVTTQHGRSWPARSQLLDLYPTAGCPHVCPPHRAIRTWSWAPGSGPQGAAPRGTGAGCVQLLNAWRGHRLALTGFPKHREPVFISRLKVVKDQDWGSKVYCPEQQPRPSKQREMEGNSLRAPWQLWVPGVPWLAEQPGPLEAGAVPTTWVSGAPLILWAEGSPSLRWGGELEGPMGLTWK